jgi:hypothetical protein
MTIYLLLLDGYDLVFGAPSDERTGLPFIYAAGIYMLNPTKEKANMFVRW